MTAAMMIASRLNVKCIRRRRRGAQRKRRRL